MINYYFCVLNSNIPSIVNNEANAFCNNHNFNEDDCIFEELDSPITASEILSVIRNLKKNKSYAGDQLLNEYFIETSDILVSHLVDLFNPYFKYRSLSIICPAYIVFNI